MSLRTKPCEHLRFIGQVNVYRLSDVEGGPITGFTTGIEVKCADCGVPFRFKGIPFGSHPAEPRLRVDGEELRAPIEPAYVTKILGLPEGGPVAEMPAAPSPADVRMTYRPLVEGLAGKRGTVSEDEWRAAADRVFPPVERPASTGDSSASRKCSNGNDCPLPNAQCQWPDCAPHIRAFYEAPRDLSVPLRVRGVGRVADEPRALLLALNERPTDDEIRALHDHLSEVVIA